MVLIRRRTDSARMARGPSRGHSVIHRFNSRWFATAGILFVMVAPAVAQDDERPADSAPPAGATAANPPSDASAPQTGTGFDVLGAIYAYRAGDRDAAYARFLAVLERDPNEPAALYWAGLIEMERGLQARRDARATTDAGRVQALDSDARRAFGDAQRHLGRLLELAASDPEVRRVRPVEAGLTLGIAQLAGTDREQLALARGAVGTLEAYNTEMEAAGTPDYLGHFFLAIAKWRLGVWGRDASMRSSASVSFERALELAPQPDPSLPAPAGVPPERTAVELYKSYYEGVSNVLGGDRELGIRLLDGVAGRAAEYPVLEALRADATRLREKAIEAGQGYEPIRFGTPLGQIDFRGNVQIGGGYDSNVILLGEGTALPRRISKQNDWFGEILAGFDLSRRFTSEQDGFSLGRALTVGFGADTSHRWHTRIREYDINQYRGRVFAVWEPAEDWFNYWEYQFSNTELGHEPFIGTHSGYVSLTRRFSRPEEFSFGTYLSGYYQYESRRYYDPVADHRLDRDGNYHLLGIRQSVDLLRADRIWAAHYEGKEGVAADNDRRRWLRGYIGYEFRDERTQGNEFDLNGHSLLAGLEVPLPLRLSVDYGLRLSWDDYNQYSLFDATRDTRDDMRQVHTFGVGYTIVGRGEAAEARTLEVRLRAAADFVIQDGNVTDSASQDIYSYDRQQYWLALQVSF